MEYNASKPPETSETTQSSNPCTQEELKSNFYPAVCDKCGFTGCSCEWGGGGQIADTGDYFDAICPVCGSWEIEDLGDEKHKEMTIPSILYSHNGTLTPYIAERIRLLHAVSEEYARFRELIRIWIKDLRELESASVRDLDRPSNAPGTINRELKWKFIKEMGERCRELEGIINSNLKTT